MVFKMRIAAMLLALSGLASAAQAITVKAADGSGDLLVLALRAYGDPAAKDAFEKAAEEADLFPERTDDAEGEDMVLLTFMPSEEGEDLWPLFRKAKAGRFGQLRMDLVVASRGQALSSGANPMDIAKVAPASAIVEPKS